MFGLETGELIGLGIILSIAVIVIIGRKFDSSKHPPKWDEIIAFAVKNNVPGLLIEIGKPTQMKNENTWRPINIPQTELEDFSELKSILGTQPQNGVWIIPQLATVNVIRREVI